MPRPLDAAAYRPGLDGLRAIAVAAVVTYHLNPDWLPGGLMGVGAFFALSGFLITSVLLRDWTESGESGLDLGRFYLRRVRRLVPAVVLVLVVVIAATAIAVPQALVERINQAFAALLYVANWNTIVSGLSYFGRFGAPAPLDHLWSLSVEEQFYLIWPVLLLVLLRVCRGRLRVIAAITAVLAAGSFIAMAVLAVPGFDQTRVYEGTDTRSGGLLTGAVVAMLWHPVVKDRLSTWTRAAIGLAGVAGLAVMGTLFWSVDQYSLFLYRGGLAILAASTSAVALAVSTTGVWLGPVLGLAPLRWIGERSYGIYLWHVPVLAFTPIAVFGQGWIRAGVVVTATLALAAVSWAVVEDPIRRWGFDRTMYWYTPPKRSLEVPRGFRWKWLAGVVAFALVATAVLSVGPILEGGLPQSVGQGDAGTTPLPGDDQPTGPVQDTVPTPTTSPSGAATSCRGVAHIGDSTSLGLISAAAIPNAKDRLVARYEAQGATKVVTDIRGARSIVEKYQGEPNAQEAATGILATGYRGCWVLALGNNEAANQYVGGTHPLPNRIDIMMKTIGDQPVMWLTTKTLRTSGPYADSVIQEWNSALRKACSRYPNLRVYDWAAEVQDSWFGPDRIHYTSQGWKERARRIASALSHAYPATGTSSCFVGS